MSVRTKLTACILKKRETKNMLTFIPLQLDHNRGSGRSKEAFNHYNYSVNCGGSATSVIYKCIYSIYRKNQLLKKNKKNAINE